MQEVKKKFSACKQFFNLESDARIISATLNVLGIQSLDGVPEEDIVPKAIHEASLETRKAFLKELCFKVVDKFVLREEEMGRLVKKLEKGKDNDVGMLPNGRFPCRYAGCKKSFVRDGKAREDHEKAHGLHKEQSAAGHLDETVDRDDMLNYQYALLEYGMLFRNFSDAVSEGDGQRTIRCWKFFLMFLKGDGQRSCKYALEGLNIMCQVYAILSPRDAHRLIWNRSVKAKSGIGENIPLDLALEHFNRVLKQVIKNMGPNAANEKAVNRFAKAMGVTKQLMDNFDLDCKVLRRAGHHIAKAATSDLKKIVAELVKFDVFTLHADRKYKKFVEVEPSLLSNFKMDSMFKWINEHKRTINLNKSAR